MCRLGMVLCIVMRLRLTGMRHEVVALEFVVCVVGLELVLVRLHLTFMVLQRCFQLFLEVGFGLSLPLPLPLPVVLWWHRVLPLSLVLDGGSHHGREVLSQLGGKLEVICAHRRARVLLLWGRRVLEPLKAMQTMVLVLVMLVVLLLVLRLGVLMAHLRFQIAVLCKLLVVLCFCSVDNGRRIALLHHSVLFLRGRLCVVHHEGCSELPRSSCPDRS